MLVLLAACGPTESTWFELPPGAARDTALLDTAVPDTTPSDTADCEATDSCALVPYFFWTHGVFAYDAERGEVVSATAGEVAVPPTISVVYYDLGAYELVSQGHSCTLTFTYTGPDPLPVTTYTFDHEGETLSHVGFRLPEGVYTAQGCEDLDPEAFGTASEIAMAGWGLGLGTPTAGTQAMLESYGERELYTGASTWWGGLLEHYPDLGSEFAAMGFANAYPIDAEHRLLDAAGEVAGPDDALAPLRLDGETLPSGLYYVSPFDGLFVN